MRKCLSSIKAHSNKYSINCHIYLRKWSNNKNKRMYTSSLLNYKVEETYKYSCVVPYKNDNIFTLEKEIYDEKYSHVFIDKNIEIESDLYYLYKLLINSRTIEQIRLQVYSSYCAYENNFINDMKKINWNAYIPFSSVLREPEISITSIKSRLYHTCMIKNIILNVIKRQQQLYIEKNGDENILLKKKKLISSQLTPLKINVLFKYNECKIHINLSNNMNIRVYEAYKNQQSLKSTIIASAIFKLNLFKYINNSKQTYIIDPFCNDGTAILEILSILLTIPNGSPSINYPIFTYPLHSPSTFYNVLNEIIISPLHNMTQVYFLGMDEKKEHIKHANRNLMKFVQTIPLKNDITRYNDHPSLNINDPHVHTLVGDIKNVTSNQKNNYIYINKDNNINYDNINKHDDNNSSDSHIKKKTYKQLETLSTQQLKDLFDNEKKSEKISINNKSFLLNNIKFCSFNFLKLNNVIENCIIITNIMNMEKKKILKFEKILLRSYILNAYVFSNEKYKENTQLQFRLIARFISNGQNVLFLQLFNKTKRSRYEDYEEN
ncbi:hypothetical protein PRSY57_1025600 [Plasmodium reichenowi]|uniref:Uncharacterized protein n=1 Tax=Plasmodium reichenowi TaxID=5854 RepID=A0A151LFI8_PLARE|nr:hypothetical protein PRSY57_1025600 [Plasmodium reichenowi]KYN97721.1 hypothetical protein PRSY57_1025600 [Plasmodium reichenowi]